MFARVRRKSQISVIYGAFWILISLEKSCSGNNIEELKIDEVITFLSKPFVLTENVTADCFNSSVIYYNALKEYKKWAWQMYDASSKVPLGILTGNTNLLGNYDECLNVKSEHGFTGQACIAEIYAVLLKAIILYLLQTMNLDKLRTFRYERMSCVPSTCNDSEFLHSLDRNIDPLRLQDNVKVTLKINKVTCYSKETDRRLFYIADWIYTGILLLFLTIILLSTGYDFCTQKRIVNPKTDDSNHVLLTSFSLHANVKKLYSTKRPDASIACLDGLRFLSTCWIIFGHTYYVETIAGNINLSHILTLHESLTNMFILSANIVTDIFLLLSATLFVYNLLQNEQIFTNSFNVIYLCFLRYIRVTPVYAILIGFYATLFYKLGSGPKWNEWVGIIRNDCQENWWTNLLYINNFVNIDYMCLVHSWYLSVDMQLFWISVIFLYPMLKFNKYTLLRIFLSVAFVISILVPFLVTYLEKLPGTMIYYMSEDTAKVFTMIYVKTYARAGPYIVGLGLGWLLYNTRSCQLHMKKHVVVIGWVVAPIVAILVILGSQQLYYEYDRIVSSLYSGLHRHIFVLTISWIIFASSHGYAGIIGQFLSWPGWMIFSKLTFCLYLCHYPVLLYYGGSIRTVGNLTSCNVVRIFFGNLAISLLISTVVCLFFEMPFITLSKVLLKSRRVRLKSRNEECSGSRSVIGINGNSVDSVNSLIPQPDTKRIDTYKRISCADNNSNGANVCTNSRISTIV